MAKRSKIKDDDIKNFFKVTISEEGRVFYILKYTKSDGYETVLCVTKHHGDLYIEFMDIINITSYKVISATMYRRMDMKGVKYFKQPCGDSGTYEIDAEFIRVDNVFKWLTGSTKPEAKLLLSFIDSNIVPDKEKFEDFNESESRKNDYNFFPYKDNSDDNNEIDIEALTDAILSNSGVRKAIINVLKSKLK
jgi:hypothetical protein